MMTKGNASETRVESEADSGLVDVQGAAQILQVSPFTIRNWKATGVLAYVQIGRRILFDRKDLQDFIDRNRVPARHENDEIFDDEYMDEI